MSANNDGPEDGGLIVATKGGPRSSYNDAAFILSVDENVLVDLRTRLSSTRWPDEIPGAGWEYGSDLTFMRRLVHYWTHKYDWRRAERRFNSFNNRHTVVCGVTVHYILEVGEGDAPMPLLLPHGWPGSVAEFFDLIPRLTHQSRYGGSPEDAFTVVAPSLPGHGLSFKPGQRRLGIPEIADVLANLMVEVLRFERYGVHGHDWGAFIATRLGYSRPEELNGIHLALLAVPRDPAVLDLTNPEEADFATKLRYWLSEETGYSLMMATRPQTLAYALTDSPVGLAAWIIEKFRGWSDCDGEIESRFSLDTLLTNIMLYWTTEAINSSFWPYYARKNNAWIVPEGERVSVAMGYSERPFEILNPPRSVADRYYADIRRWTKMTAGGHFPALETPDTLATEIRTFFSELRAKTNQPLGFGSEC